MSRQLKPLKDLQLLQKHSEEVDAPELKGEGSYEIRQTSQAFNQMRTRIKDF